MFYEQVDSVEKIEKLLKGQAADLEDLEDSDFTGWPSADYNCLLIEVLAYFQSESLQACMYICTCWWVYTEPAIHEIT